MPSGRAGGEQHFGIYSVYGSAGQTPSYPQQHTNGVSIMPVEDRETARAADEKKKALNLAIAQIEKQVGKGSIMRMGQDSWVKVDAIPTGAINLDASIGVGGIPRGRITEIYG